MSKEYRLCGLGNAIVDIFLEVSEEEFVGLGLDKGTMRLVDHQEQKHFLERFASHDPRLVSGGSVANSVIGFAQLGGRAAFVGCLGDDRYGLHYQQEFESLGIDMGAPVIVDETTGTCVCLITPDAERTMRTCIAGSGRLSAAFVDEERIRKSEWLFIEGYLFANPDNGQSAIRRAMEYAKKHGTKIALTCSEAFILEHFGEPFFSALEEADLLFCNASESVAVARTTTPREAFQRLAGLVPNCVVTDGPHGAYVRYNGIEVHVPAFECTPKDLTGAGDMFAGAFLYGVTHGYSPFLSGRAACYLAMKVITQIGARLHTDVPRLWTEGTSLTL